MPLRTLVSVGARPMLFGVPSVVTQAQSHAEVTRDWLLPIEGHRGCVGT